MSDNADWMKIVVKGVKLLHPKLDRTYRFDTAAQRSEPCAQTAQGAAWSVSWEMDRAAAATLYKQLAAHYAACKQRDAKLPAFAKVFGMKKTEDGPIIFAARRNGVNGSGNPNRPPEVVDGRKEPLENRAFWSGSIGSVVAEAFATRDPQGNGGISLMLKAVQVIKAEYGSSAVDDFDVVDTPATGGPADDFDSFDTPAPAPAAKPAPSQHAPISTGLDDEIPF